ncbi:tryptophan 7-halogenase [Alkalicaulis satelles]|uniref:Tryptophan 7-halogenase n=1 Tax=Alkalicaulis satelles TaxID=2609175 RepID=A0A5M6ZN78_9PROT|nr:tryptophan 7-halogenase [Alkalicaulis satelles]KAA5805044.1 tryptophan 7-halogenase [Alkalicaulis satelles]
MSGAPGHIFIAGGGVAGWMFALAAARALAPLGVQITVADDGRPDESLGAQTPALSTLPGAQDHHHGLGLDDLDVLRAARGSFKLGERHTGWAPGADTVLPYGDTGADIGPVRFHQQLMRLGARAGDMDLAAYSLAGEAARLGRFAPPSPDPASFLSTLDFGLHLETAGYARLLRAAALQSGAKALEGRVMSARRGDDGALTAALLEDGRAIEADVFIDATGERAALISGVLGVGWESWAAPGFDRIASTLTQEGAAPAPLTHNQADAAGWVRTIPLYGARSDQLVFASSAMDDAAAIGQLGGAASVSAFNPGRRTAPWSANCLAVGAAACRPDPLASAEAHLAASAALRFLKLVPHGDGGAVEAREYNRVFEAETGSVRDFAAHAYLAQTRKEAPWARARTLQPSPELARRMALYAARGRIMRSEDAVYDEAMWAAAFIARRVQPHDHDPLANGLDEAALKHRCEHIRQLAAQTARRLPAHGDMLAQLHGRAP